MKKKSLFLGLATTILLIPNVVFANTKITNHSVMSHTREEVIEKYNSSLSTYDYSLGYYVNNPIFTAPYYEGILKDEVKEDVLKQYNYYRWLAGLNSVTINTDKMQRSQKAAFIQYLNNELSHYPSQPSDMNDEFYKQAYAGASASSAPGDTYSGNISAGTPSIHYPYDLVKGWVDDSSNVTTNMSLKVGHRSSMLDPRAKSISFGFTHVSQELPRSMSYAAMSVYRDYTNSNPDTFYAWPPSGYIPCESFPGTRRTYWSIWVGNNYKKQETTKVTITVNDKNYVITNDEIYSDTADTTLFYKIPDELNDEILRGNGQYISETPIKMSFTDLTNSNSTEYFDIEYTTTFVQVVQIPVQSITVFANSTGTGSFTSLSTTRTNNMNKGDVKYYMYQTTPSNATTGKIVITSEDESILKVDQNAKTITALKGGDTKLIVTEADSGYRREYYFHVENPATGIELDKNKLFIIKGKTANLTASLLPEDATTVPNYTWNSSNPSVAAVDNSGNITGLSNGTATITVSINGLSNACEVTVGDFLKGDLDRNGSLSISDVIEALFRIVGKVETTDEDYEIGDMDGDGDIDISDAIEIIWLFIND